MEDRHIDMAVMTTWVLNKQGKRVGKGVESSNTGRLPEY